MNFKEYKKNLLEKNPEIKKEYDALEPEFQLIRAVIDARLAANLTQAEFAAKVGTSQANISKLENGVLNPSVEFLKKVATACDKELIINFK